MIKTEDSSHCSLSSISNGFDDVAHFDRHGADSTRCSDRDLLARISARYGSRGIAPTASIKRP
jgi:hypothetical protein